MKWKFKERASKKLANMDPLIDREKFTSPNSTKLYINVFVDLKVVHGCIIQKGQEVCFRFSLLPRFGLDKFLNINEEIS